MSKITIYHNPGCGTSRNVVAMIEAAGYRPTVIEYLKTGWTTPLLQTVLAAMGAAPREVLREKGTPYHELGLGFLTLPEAHGGQGAPLITAFFMGGGSMRCSRPTGLSG